MGLALYGPPTQRFLRLSSNFSFRSNFSTTTFDQPTRLDRRNGPPYHVCFTLSFLTDTIFRDCEVPGIVVLLAGHALAVVNLDDGPAPARSFHALTLERPLHASSNAIRTNGGGIWSLEVESMLCLLLQNNC